MLHVLLTCSLLLLNATFACAATINFDDLDASAGDVVLGSYQGFSWLNFSAYTTTPGFQGFNKGIVSPANAAYSGGQVFSASVQPIIGTITSSTPFNLISGYLGSGYYDALNITIKGIRNGTTVFSKTVSVNTQGAKLFSFGFDDLTEVAMFASTTGSTTDPFSCGSFNCTQFTLDNFTYTPYIGPPPPSSPEPSTISLFGVGGAAGFWLFRRRKARA